MTLDALQEASSQFQRSAGALKKSAGTFGGEERMRGSFRIKSTSYVMENVKCVHDSIKAPVWSPASWPNFSKSCGGWAVRASVASSNGRRLCASDGNMVYSAGTHLRF